MTEQKRSGQRSGAAAAAAYVDQKRSITNRGNADPNQGCYLGAGTEDEGETPAERHIPLVPYWPVVVDPGTP